VFDYLNHTARVVEVFSFFNLVSAWNTGVSFSMFNDLGGMGVYILSLFALIVVGFLFFWLRKEQSCLMQLALGFVIGGAVGNVIDRLRQGAVFDFLDVHVGAHHWPAFNVADSFICIGACLIICHGVFAEKDVKKVKSIQKEKK
jgi:signal peptidase II